MTDDEICEKRELNLQLKLDHARQDVIVARKNATLADRLATLAILNLDRFDTPRPTDIVKRLKSWLLVQQEATNAIDAWTEAARTYDERDRVLRLIDESDAEKSNTPTPSAEKETP